MSDNGYLIDYNFGVNSHINVYEQLDGDGHPVQVSVAFQGNLPSKYIMANVPKLE